MPRYRSECGRTDRHDPRPARARRTVLIAWASVLSGLPALAAAQTTPLRFLDRTSAAGLDAITWSGSVEKNHILESAGNGVVAVDFDNDAWPDLFFPSAHRFRDGTSEPHSGQLYRNRRDGSFATVTAAAGTTTHEYSSGGCVGDFDGDGLTDIYMTALGPDVLFRNNGDGTFSRVAVGIDAPGWSTGAAFFDADGDGDQDLFVAAYVRATIAEALAAVRFRMWRGRVPVLDGPRGLPGDRNRFFRNRGDGTFEEDTEAAGFGALADSYAFGVLTLDADGDGDTDLYVANDSQPNALYLNAAGHFSEVGTESGLAYNASGAPQGSMGVDAGDIDGDGRDEIAVTNFASDAFTVYRSLGAGSYRDDSFAFGTAVPTYSPLGWAALFFDAELDGDLDLFFANGHLYAQVDAEPALGESYRQANQLFVNDGGRLTLAEGAGDGLERRESSRGAALLDYDLDGDLDLAVSNQDAPPNLIENASDRAGSWLGLSLSSRVGDRQALGAVVVVTTGSGRLTRTVRSGGSYMSQSELHLHIGVGRATSVAVEVRWPDGLVQLFDSMTTGARYGIHRGAQGDATVRTLRRSS